MTLREYQIRDVERIEDSLDECGHSLYVLPTGGGKTVIAAAVIERAVERGERVLVLTHRREILLQTSLKLPVEHGLIQAGLGLDMAYPVQVASLQTLWSRAMRANKMPLPAADLIVIDEAHHMPAKTCAKILDQYPEARRLGLTATPCRGDGRGLGNHFKEIVLGPQVSELIEQGHLVGTVYYAPATPNLKGVQTQKGDYVISQLAARVDRDDMVGDIVTQWHKHAERRKTLVFCVNVAHSQHVADEFVRAGIKAEHLDGATPKEERDAVLRRLASGETQVVCNCMVLTEGFDCPDVGCIVLARPTRQLGLFRQMAGRGLRPVEGKKNLVLLDHAGSVFMHGLLEDPITWTFDEDRKARNKVHEKRNAEARSRLTECSQCGALRVTGEACGNCGFLPKLRGEAITFAPGDLGRLDRDGESKHVPASQLEKRNWYSMLLHIADRSGYKTGWAAHKFKERFGEWPGDRNMPMYPPTPEVTSWVRSRQIAYAKSKEKERDEAAARERYLRRRPKPIEFRPYAPPGRLRCEPVEQTALAAAFAKAKGATS
jgi:superfamily II DNA or RNA helicase